MINQFNAFNEKYPRRYYLLLLALIMLFILRPFVEEFFNFTFIMDMFLSFVLFSGVYAVYQNKLHLIVSTMIASLTFGVVWSLHFTDNPALEILSTVMGIIFFFHIAFTIFFDIFLKRKQPSMLY